MNIYTGAYYLAVAFQRWGYNWRAVGAYNAGFSDKTEQEKKRQKYAKEIKGIYMKMYAGKNWMPSPLKAAQIERLLIIRILVLQTLRPFSITPD